MAVSTSCRVPTRQPRRLPKTSHYTGPSGEAPSDTHGGRVRHPGHPLSAGSPLSRYTPRPPARRAWRESRGRGPKLWGTETSPSSPSTGLGGAGEKSEEVFQS